MAKKNGFLDNLSRLFGISLQKDNKNGIGSPIVPVEKDEETGKVKPVEFPSSIQKLFDWFVHQTSDSADSLKNRLERYSDLSYMFYNDTVVSSAINLYADEAIQYDSQSEPLVIESKDKKASKYLTEFFDKININQQSLREIAFSLALYGDGFMVNSVKEQKGFTNSVVVDVTTIKERIEFNAIQVKKQMQQYRGFYNYISKEQRLTMLLKTLDDTKDKEDVSQYYKPYLFGFQVEDDLYLPPWGVTHFRLYSSQTEFYPYGRPILINSVSPFRQLKAAKNLMAMARSVKFPREHFSVQVSDSMTIAEKWNAVNEAKDMYQNLSYAQGSREDFAVGSSIWTPMGALELKMLENSTKLDDIADVELLRDDLIMGTKIPKGYLIVDKSGWGASGQALLQQYKPFGRSVLQIQQSILRELIQMAKIQFIMDEDSGFDEDTEFELSMHFPIIEDSVDRMQHKNSTIELAKNIVDTLKTTLGINTKLPVDIVKDIFNKFTFLDPADIEDWIKTITSESEKLSEEEKGKIKKRINEDVVREVYFKEKKKMNLTEGISHRRHYMASWGKYDPLNEEILGLLKKDKILRKKRINE